MNEPAAQFIVVGSQHPVPVPVLLFIVSFAVVVAVSVGRCEGTGVIDAEGQINEDAAQFMVAGSQQVLLYESFADIVGDCVGRGVDADVMDADGQITESDGQFIVIGSQHEPEPAGDLGVCVVEGVAAAMRSEQSGSPGEHDPREGSQHLTPLKVESPRFVV